MQGRARSESGRESQRNLSDFFGTPASFPCKLASVLIHALRFAFCRLRTSNTEKGSANAGSWPPQDLNPCPCLDQDLNQNRMLR